MASTDASLAGLKRLLDDVSRSLIASEEKLKSYKAILDTLDVSKAANLFNIVTRGIERQSLAVADLRSEYSKLISRMRNIDPVSEAFFGRPLVPPKDPNAQFSGYSASREAPLSNRLAGGPATFSQERLQASAIAQRQYLLGEKEVLQTSATYIEELKAKFIQAEKEKTSAAETSARRIQDMRQSILGIPQSGGDLGGRNAGASEQEPPFETKQLEALTKLYPQVSKAAAEYGFTMDKLQGVSREASTGIQQWGFQMTDANGIVRNLSLTTNKMGEVLVDTQKRFRGFGSAVARNISEVFKWAIAAQLIWLPMRKLQEVTGEMIELQTKLAAAVIATGQAFEDSARIFQAAYDVAQSTGSTISGVVEGYELAYRAAGRYGDGNERAQKSTALLRDAMLLASITTYDEAKALDVLVGGLIQTGKELDQGIELLDSWVAVSKNAAVSIETLAESFAITSSSAGNAGIDIDMLNGYVSVLAENLPGSATEIANAFRAFVTGYATDKAVKEMENLGIAIVDTNDDALAFDFVMQQIYSRYKAGLISPTQLNELGAAIGGGNRRATQFITLLENLDRVQQIAGVSASAAGDAEDALAVQMGTVTKSLTKLENAFKLFAQTLGTDGGVLDGISSGADKLTFLLEVLSELVKVFGNSVPVIGAFGIAFAKSFGDIDLLNAKLTEMSVKLANVTLRKSKLPYYADPTRADLLGGQTRYTPQFMEGVGTYGMAGVMTALQVGGSFTAKQYGRAGGQLAGGIGGAVLGKNLIGGAAGATIGSAIGAAIVSAMTSAIWDYQSDWESFFSGTLENALDDLESGKKSLLDMNVSELKEVRDEISETATRGLFKDIATSAVTLGDYIFGDLFGTDLTREEVGFELFVKDEDRAFIERIEELIAAKDTPATTVDLGGAIAVQTQFQDVIAREQGNLETKLRNQVVSGDVNSKRFKELSDRIAGFGGIASNAVYLIGEELMELNPEIENTTQLFEYLMDFLYYASDDQIKQLSGMVGEMIEYEKAVSNSTATQEDFIRNQQLMATLPTYLTTANVENRGGRVNIPTVMDLTDYGAKALGIGMEKAEQDMRAIWAQMVEDGLTDGLEYIDWKNSITPFYVELADGTYQIIKGVTSDALKDGFADAEEEGLISVLSGLGVMDLSDYTQDEFNKLMAPAPQVTSAFESLGYEPKYEDQLVVFKDGIASMTIEQTITNLLLKDILDTQEKQLEGVYNLPANMSMYVPFSGYALGQSTGSTVNLSGWENLINILGDMRRAMEEPDISGDDEAWTEPDERYQPINEVFDELKSSLLENVAVPSTFTGTRYPEMADFYQIPGERPEEEPSALSQAFAMTADPWGMMGVDLSTLGADLKNAIIELFRTIFAPGEGGLINQGEPIGVGEGAGVGDVLRGLLESIIAGTTSEYFSSGQMHEDAMKGTTDTGVVFEKLIEAMQNLSQFDFYDKAEGVATSVIDFFKNLFGGEEEVLSSGGGSGGVLKSPTETQNAGIVDALAGLLEAIRSGTVSDYFTSGQFHDDMMQGATSPEESFGRIIEWLQGLEIFSPYGMGEDGGLIDQFRQLFQEATATTLNLEIQSNTVLTLDGQTVATSVKSYLAEDLINQEVASGDVARTVVI